MPLLKTALFLLTFVFSQFLFSQNSPNWTLTNTNGLVNPIFDILFVSNQHGYLLSGDKILESTDGGDTWNLKITSSIINNNYPYNVFFGGLILKNDSIISFLKDTNYNSYELTFSIYDSSGIYNVKPQVFALGYNLCVNFVCAKQYYSFNNEFWGIKNNAVVKSKNGVETTLKSNIECLTITDKWISAANRDWLYYSSDSALTWDSISLIDTAWNLSIVVGAQQMQIYYNGGDTMFVIGRTYPSYDLVSFNKGQSWQSLSIPPNWGRKPLVYNFYSNTRIIGNFGGVVLTSTDGGFNFSPDTVDYNMPYSKMYVYNDSLAFLYGRNGKVYKSVNAGGLTEVKQEKGETQFQLFPNPASDNLHLNLELKRTLNQLTLFDVQGKLIKRFNPAQRVLDISEVPNGLYFLNLNFEKESYSQKVIINH